MLLLRDLSDSDMSTISRWPPYPLGFEELDYALRVDGWLTEFRNKPVTWCFAAEQAGELIAFTILSSTERDEAEFRIALRADRIGQGLGFPITALTQKKGFFELGLSRIHLIARKNNPTAIHLYKKTGFVERGVCCKDTNGKRVEYLTMDLTKDAYAMKESGSLSAGCW